MSKKYIVKFEATLLDYLIDGLKMKRSEAKKQLKNMIILVNGKKVSQFDYQLFQNDKLEIQEGNRVIEGQKKLPIIYEDDDFVVVNKPGGLLSMATEKEKINTAYHMVRTYVKNKNPYHKIFILHRLDEDTSGVLAFCKNIELRDLLQENWNEIVTKRSYYACVLGKLEGEGHIEQYLKINEQGNVNLSKDVKNAKVAITDYQVIKSNGEYSFVDIDLKTGRKNQIRVAFSSMGHPIVGDKKYGKNKANRLYLHAYNLTFKHPITNKEYSFEAECPFDLKNIKK